MIRIRKPIVGTADQARGQAPAAGNPEFPTDHVVLLRDGKDFSAMVGPNLREGIAGWGPTIPGALRDLASAMDRENWESPVVIWKRPPAVTRTG